MISDIVEYADNAAGRPFDLVADELEKSGFLRGDVHKNRVAKTNLVEYHKGHHECRTRIKVEHDWVFDKYGMGKPGKVVNIDVIEKGAREYADI